MTSVLKIMTTKTTEQRRLDEWGGKANYFPMYDDLSIESIPDPEWLVEGILPADALVEIHCAPGSMKSFTALGISMSVSSGISWAGRRVRQGDVVYVAAEGQTGYKHRMRAWKEENGVDRCLGIHIVTAPVALLDAIAIATLSEQVSRMEITQALFVFDTLSRCLAGADENSAQSMSLAIENVDRLRRKFGATVMLVHHTGKDGWQERDSSALRGAATAMYRVTKNGSRISFTCEKMKEAEIFEPLQFDAAKVGESLVLRPTEAPQNHQSDVPNITDDFQPLLSVLCVAPLRHKDWMKASGYNKTKFSKLLRQLPRTGFVVHQGDLYSLTGAGADYLTSNASHQQGFIGSEAYLAEPMKPEPLRNSGRGDE